MQSYVFQYFAICGAGTVLTLSEHMTSYPVVTGVRVARTIVFCVMFCRSLFVLLSVFFWPLYCLSFLDIRLQITTLVSSNFLAKLGVSYFFLVSSTNKSNNNHLAVMWIRNIAVMWIRNIAELSFPTVIFGVYNKIKNNIND